MLAEFFQIGPIPANQMTGSYDTGLVILSYLVATFASYIALDFTGRLRDPSNTSASSLFWLIGGAIAMGAGIWSMHFIGMLSFSMPHMIMQYDLFWTSLSLVVAMLASGFALSLLKTKIINIIHFAIGGVILGFGIAAMHYTGMEAMKTTMVIHYLPSLFILSIVIAIAASEAALWLAIQSNQVVSKSRIKLKLISAAIMGIAIVGMHYTGMAAAIFTPHPSPTNSGALDPTVMAMSIAAVTFIILGVAFFASTYKEALNQKQLENARQLGIAEVSASVLHNVGNVLNSVNVSASIVSEKIANSKISELENLSALLNENKQNLSSFFENDTRGKKIPDFITALAKYLRDEQKIMMQEMELLKNNLLHIKDIISTQQGISKITGLEQVISINDVLDEAILIVGVDTANNFKIKKEYSKLKPILSDKVKLLQIFVNLLTNAKDSLRSSGNENSYIKIYSTLKGNKNIQIKICDTGTGIASQNINKIFTYGFTTKETGHGFGLHTCALAVNEMGGELRAESEGLGKGATFILDLPYRAPHQ